MSLLAQIAIVIGVIGASAIAAFLILLLSAVINNALYGGRR